MTAPGIINSYTADGRIAKMLLGNGLYETREYNTPVAPTIYKLGTDLGIGDLTQMEYDFSESANNGNVKGQRIKRSITGTGTFWERRQEYDYDGANRLLKAREKNAANNTDEWSRIYRYDRYGNGWVSSFGITNVGSPAEPTLQSHYNAANNRLSIGTGNAYYADATGVGYDAAGNQTLYDGMAHEYDAEGRNTKVKAGNADYVTFTYDGEGRSVKKASGGITTYYVYNAMGQMAAEYTNEVTMAGTTYLFTDMLGSVRTITDAGGNVTECYDYLPFGRLLSSSDNGRSVIKTALGKNCYPDYPDTNIDSSVDEKFTGQKRDNETGLDYFEARYYSAPLGRFTSPDPGIVTPARMIDPQRFNLYTYARNNPLKFVDPNGEDIWFANDTEEGRRAALAKILMNVNPFEATNIYICEKDGVYTACIKDINAFGKNASIGYKEITELINDHSIIAEVGLIGDGLTATFQEGGFAGYGPISSWSRDSSVLAPLPNNNHVNVIVTKGDLPGGVQVWNGKQAVQGREPDYMKMYHELIGETLKYRAGYEHLFNNSTLDNRTIIKIENEMRQSRGMYPRTGADHGIAITVNGKIE